MQNVTYQSVTMNVPFSLLASQVFWKVRSLQRRMHLLEYLIASMYTFTTFKGEVVSAKSSTLYWSAIVTAGDEEEIITGTVLVTTVEMSSIIRITLKFE